MYEVRKTDEGLWQILDEAEQPVFTGTQQQCEDWLDATENLSRAKPSPSRPLRELLRRVLAKFGRSGGGPRAE